MELFRLSREKYAHTLSGVGAAKQGARWNSKGVEMVYLAGNRSLAMAEVAVHFTAETIPDDYVMITIEVPDDLEIKILGDTDLPTYWDAIPHTTNSQFAGDQFIAENKYCMMNVPSAVTTGDRNFVINPMHTKFDLIKIKEIKPFKFDERLL